MVKNIAIGAFGALCLVLTVALGVEMMPPPPPKPLVIDINGGHFTATDGIAKTSVLCGGDPVSTIILKASR